MRTDVIPCAVVCSPYSVLWDEAHSSRHMYPSAGVLWFGRLASAALRYLEARYTRPRGGRLNASLNCLGRLWHRSSGCCPNETYLNIHIGSPIIAEWRSTLPNVVCSTQSCDERLFLVWNLTIRWNLSIFYLADLRIVLVLYSWDYKESIHGKLM